MVRAMNDLDLPVIIVMLKHANIELVFYKNMFLMKNLYKRKLAYVIDCVIAYAAVMLFIIWAILSQFRDQLGITGDFRVSIHLQISVFLTITIPVWTYIAMMDSKASRGTWGKRICRIRVFRETWNRQVLFENIP